MNFEYFLIILFQFLILIIFNKFAYKLNLLDYPNDRKFTQLQPHILGDWHLQQDIHSLFI